MKIIETAAVEPQPVRQKGSRSEVKEIFIFDQHDHFVGTEWRIIGESEDVE